jgi:hypothetical protein
LYGRISTHLSYDTIMKDYDAVNAMFEREWASRRAMNKVL